MQWVEGKANEKKPGKDTQPKLKQGQAWVPVYDTLGAILDEYGGGAEPDAPAVPDAELNALVAAMEESAPVAF